MYSSESGFGADCAEMGSTFRFSFDELKSFVDESICVRLFSKIGVFRLEIFAGYHSTKQEFELNSDTVGP